MSKNDKTEQAAQPDDEEAIDVDAEPEPEPEPKQLRRGASAAVAWLALVLSLAAIAYTAVQDWRARSSMQQSDATIADSIADLGRRSDASGETLSTLDRSLSELTDANARTSADVDILQRDLDNRLDLFSSLPSRMSNLENSMAALQGVSAGARDTWLLAEAEYYMQIANAQLQLAGNPHLAALALGMADERVVKLANPALTDVRRAISDELAALEIMDKPDIQGVTLTLASLARVVDSLPLRQANAAVDEDTAEFDGELSGVDRAWNSLKGAVSGLVKVTPPDQASMPLIAPESVYFLRTNLSLQLQSARLALLRGEKAVFEQSLDDSAAWLRQYFDTDSAQVSSALQTIREIRDGLFTVKPPDISESLRLLRQFNTLSEPAQ